MQPWSVAWEQALYSSGGFFLRERPGDHFRTSVTASPAFAAAVRELAGTVDDQLGRPDPYDVVDLGAGRGELLSALPDVPARWRLTAVERAPDPGVGVRWRDRVPRLTGLLLANEWLDDVPLDVVSRGRLVLVGAGGAERLGPPAPPELLEWCRRWWPRGRAEVGLSRDLAWAAAVRQVRRGLAVAVDYGHRLPQRRATLTGYRRGRQVPPVPDGSCDLSAHVALDSCAAAAGSLLTTQRAALRELGVTGQVRVTDLQRTSDEAELLDPAGLGGFGWLLSPVALGACRDPALARLLRPAPG